MVGAQDARARKGRQAGRQAGVPKGRQRLPGRFQAGLPGAKKRGVELRGAGGVGKPRRCEAGEEAARESKRCSPKGEGRAGRKGRTTRTGSGREGPAWGNSWREGFGEVGKGVQNLLGRPAWQEEGGHPWEGR